MEIKGRFADIATDFITGETRITFVSPDTAQIREFYDNSKEMSDLRITAVKWREKRSLNANSYFHLLCDKIAKAVGGSQTLTRVKNKLIAEHGQFDEDMPPLILRADVEWLDFESLHLYPTSHTKEMNGKDYRVYLVRRGSHTYDTKEMSELIEATVSEARELGIETLTPAELERLVNQWRNQ